MAEPVTWMTLATLASAGGQLYAGQQAKSASKQTAALQEEQGRIASLEAQREAAQTVENAQKFRDRQILAYMKSGVTLAGSPLLVLEETITKSDEEADAIRKRGEATQRLAYSEASITRRTGRSQYISGITGAVGTLGSNYATGRAAGIYGNSQASATGKGTK